MSRIASVSASQSPADAPPTGNAPPVPAPANNLALIVTGALQGVLLWLIWFALREQLWPADTPTVLVPLTIAGFAVPLAVYWSADAPRGMLGRWSIVLLLGAVFAYIAWHQAATGLAAGESAFASHLASSPFAGFAAHRLLAAWVAGAMLVHLLGCVGRGDYRAYFELSWHNAIATVLACLFAAMVWVVLFAGAMLLKTVGIDFFASLLREDWVWIPLTSCAVAIGIVAARRWASATQALRRVWLALNAGLLPVALVFGLIWALALPFVGIGGATERPVHAVQLLWFLALAVYFLNALWQDGREPPLRGAGLLRVLRWAWLVTIGIAGVAIWAIALRVRQYGWTEARIWSALVAIAGFAYALGYALPGRGERWMPWVGTINRVLAWALSLAIVALLTPLADARRLAVDDQMRMLRDGRIPAAAYDFAYLRWHSGTYGIGALQRLVEGPDPQLARLAVDVLAQRTERRVGPPLEPVPAPEAPSAAAEAPGTQAAQGQALESWVVDGLAPDPDFMALFEAPYADALERRCRAGSGWRCAAWVQQIDGAGEPETLLLQYAPDDSGDRLLVYGRRDGALFRLGEAAIPRLDRFDDWRERIARQGAKLLPPLWPDLEIDGFRMTIVPGASKY